MMRDVLYDIKNYIRGVGWLVLNYRKVARLMRDRHHMIRLRPFKIVSWNRGSRYFTANYHKKTKVFVKLEGVYALLGNEINAHAKMQSQFPNGRTSSVLVAQDLKCEFPFVAFRWINGVQLEVLLRRRIKDAERLLILAFLRKSLLCLRQAKIIHRDFTPFNLIVEYEDGGIMTGIVIIDFAFSVVDGHFACEVAIPMHELMSLGKGYKPDPARWDDAYSCAAIMERLCEGAPNLLQQEEVKLTRSEIGQFSYGID